jgi:HEAT repeat protein
MRDVGEPTPFVLALNSRSEEVRKFAALALGQIADNRAVGPLAEALGDASWDVRQAAALSLGQLSSAAALAPLRAALGDSDLGVRDAAAAGLIRIGKPALETLVAALEAERWDERRTAALALGEIGDPDATEPLLEALRNRQDSWLRRNAATALGQIGDVRALPSLEIALNDDDASVCEAAGEAMREISAGRTLEPAVSDPKEDLPVFSDAPTRYPGHSQADRGRDGGALGR